MERVLFSKYSNERAAQFAVRTDIIEEHGIRWVKKSACQEEGKPHVENIFKAYTRLSEVFRDTKISVNTCELMEQGIKMEYLTGKTLQELLDAMLKRGEIQEFKNTVGQYIELIRMTETRDFVMTPEFRQVFGEAEGLERFGSGAVTDIDMVLSNIFVGEDGSWNLIDYEWTFDFPVPVEYVIYRMIHYYEYSNAFRNQIAGWDLYRAAGISQKDKEIFGNMEISFQNYVIGNYVPMRHLYPAISPGTTDLKAILENKKTEEKIQVFVSKDGLFREEDSHYFPMTGGKGKISMEIGEGTAAIRIDPGEKPGKLKIKKLEWGTKEACTVRTNGIQQAEGEILFIEEDPQILIEGALKEKRILCMEFFKDRNPGSYEEQIKRDREELNRMKEEAERMKLELLEKERVIAAMENTKVWKTYKKYRTMMKREQS